MSRPRLPSSRFSKLAISTTDEGGDDQDNEDDAWALDSDDEQQMQGNVFAANAGAASAPRRHQPQPAKPMMNASAAAAAPQITTSAAASSSSTSLPRPPTRNMSSTSISSTGSSSSSSRRHAPPARPHPFPIPSQPQRTSSGWTMVDRTPSTSNMRSVSGTVPLAGSPPTDVGSSAAEAVLHAGIPSDRPTRAHTTGQIGTGGGAIDPSARSGSLAMQRKRSRDKHSFIASIRPDLPAVVRDPLAALDTIASQAAAEPPSASAGASASSGITTPTSASRHVQSLGRGFNELNGRTSDNASRSPQPRSRPTSTSAGMHFDPITMSGDGLIMGGGAFSSSSTSLDQGDEQDIGQGGADDSSSDGGEDIEAEKAGAKAGSSRLTSYSTLSNNGSSSSSLGQRGKEVSPAQYLRRHPSVRTKRRWREFLRCLNGAEGNDVGAGASGNVDLTRLRELSWNGIPTELRPIAWPLLLGYLPSQASTRPSVLAKKRSEYTQAVALAFGYDPFEQGQLDGEPLAASEHGEHSSAKAPPRIDPDDPSGGRRTPVSVGSDSSSRRGGPEEKIWHQIAIDVPRTNPALPLWQRKGTQRALERLLYVWALRHDATGYVQGMSDLATPFYEVFLSNYLRSQASSTDEEDATGGVGASDLVVDPQQFDPWYLPLSARIALEADTFWCLSSLLDGIQENYVIAQPGIVRQVRRMEELVARIDAPLHAHLKEEGVEYIQFAFRWMNCLLMREMSVKNVVRLWDTYLAEGPDAFSDFHLYVCSVFLCKWSEQLKEMDFQGCIMFLQSLPTQSWSDKDAELLLSEAFVFKNLFGQTKHLND